MNDREIIYQGKEMKSRTKSAKNCDMAGRNISDSSTALNNGNVTHRSKKIEDGTG